MRDTDDALHAKENAATCGDVPGDLSQNVALLHDVTPDIAFTLSQQERSQQKTVHTSQLRHHDGRQERIVLEQNLKPQYRDEYTGEPLPSD